MAKLKPGEHVTLNVSQEANHRIYAGLSWDPNERFGFIHEIKQMMGGKKVHHDLDLACYAFDYSKALIGHVSADPAHASNRNGTIYHSGDSAEGLGEDDDEQVSVELKKLDEEIAHVAFLVTIKSGHKFGEVMTPEIKLVDGYSGHVFLKIDLSKGGGDKQAFLFAHVYRSGKGWKLHNIGAFADLQDDWAGFIRPYLTKGK